MMRRNRFLLLCAVLLSVTLLTGLMQAVSAAEIQPYIAIGGRNLLADADLTMRQGEAWAAYSPEDRTLTFSGGYYAIYTPTKMDVPGAITVRGIPNLTIRVLGEEESCVMLNTALLDHPTEETMMAAIWAPETNLTFAGGSLRCEIALPKDGKAGTFRGIAAKSIRMKDGALTVEVGDTVTNPQPDFRCLSHSMDSLSGTIGIHTSGSFTAQGSSRLQVTIGENDHLAMAMSCGGSFTVNDTAEVTLTGGASHASPTDGLSVEGNFTLNGGKVEVTAGRAWNFGSIGLRVGRLNSLLTVNGGSLTVEGGQAYGASLGMMIAHGKITGGRVIARGGVSDGLLSSGALISSPFQPFVIGEGASAEFTGEQMGLKVIGELQAAQGSVKASGETEDICIKPIS